MRTFSTGRIYFVLFKVRGKGISITELAWLRYRRSHSVFFTFDVATHVADVGLVIALWATCTSGSLVRRSLRTAQ